MTYFTKWLFLKSVFILHNLQQWRDQNDNIIYCLLLSSPISLVQVLMFCHRYTEIKIWGYVPTSRFFVFSRIFVRKPLGQIIHFQALGPTSANIYLFKVKDRNNRKKCEICSKLTRKTSEQRYDIPLLPLSEADLGLLQHARWSALW